VDALRLALMFPVNTEGVMVRLLVDASRCLRPEGVGSENDFPADGRRCGCTGPEAER
jgi:hypothetical protein